MNGILAENSYRTVAPCTNEEVRRKAHEKLDAILDQVDAVKGWFGEVGLKLPVANGQFQKQIKLTQEQNHKL
jgi:hypothetical protein